GFTLNSDGSYSFNPQDAAYEGMDAGDTQVLTIPVTVTDEHGATDTQQIQITVTGTNDTPVAGSDVTASVNEGDAAISGQLTATDADDSASLSFSITTGSSAPAGFTLNSDGSYSFNPQDSAYEGMDAGDTQVLTIPVTVTDEHGATDTQQIQITVTGTNDTPVAGFDVTASVNEGDAAISGQLTATDADDSASLSFSITSGSSAPDGFTLNADGSYSFNPQDSAYDSMSVGDSQTFTIPVTVTDEYGATDTQQIQITVTGTNDAPTAISITSSVASENAAGATIGTLSTADVDNSDTHTYTVSDNRFEVVDDGSGNKQLKLKDGVSLDHEAEDGAVSVTVTTTDADGASYNENISISVTDVNERPTAINTPISHAVAINNAGFEAQQLDDGRSTTRDIEGWDTSGRSVGVWDVSSWAFDDAPEGENAAYLVRGSTASQTLGEQFTPGQSYTLSAQVGDPEYGGDASGWAVRLYAGNQLIGSVDNADYDVPDGQFTKATLTLSAD
ncbi:MAG: VCBS domain-containing protein, partial [Amphritea sp.]|nr:VCBS domain-containing protein [Amphritea sp.]